MKVKFACLFAVLFSFHITSYAQTLKRCTAADGKVTYSDVDCPSSSKSANVKVQSVGSDVKDSSVKNAGENQTEWQAKEAEFQKRRDAKMVADAEAEKKAAAQAMAESIARGQEASEKQKQLNQEIEENRAMQRQIKRDQAERRYNQ